MQLLIYGQDVHLPNTADSNVTRCGLQVETDWQVKLTTINGLIRHVTCGACIHHIGLLSLDYKTMPPTRLASLIHR